MRACLDLCWTKCMLLFSGHTCCVFLGASVCYCQGPRAVGCLQHQRECLLSGCGALTCGFLVEMTAAGFCICLFLPIFFVMNSVKIWFVTYKGGVCSFTVLLTGARRVSGNPDTPWKDILNLYDTVITRWDAEVVLRAQSRTKSFHPCLWALDRRPAGCCCY